MKDELQGKMVEILTSIQAATGKASDFAVTQLPDIAQSYIMYGLVSSLIQLAVWLIATLISLLILKWLWQKPTYCTINRNGTDRVRSDSNHVFLVSCSFTSLFTAANAVSCLLTVSLVWFAPKVWLLKELASLIK